MTIDEKIRAVREAQTRLEIACENCEPDAELAQLERDTLAAAFFPDLIDEIVNLREVNQRMQNTMSVTESNMQAIFEDFAADSDESLRDILMRLRVQAESAKR